LSSISQRAVKAILASGQSFSRFFYARSHGLLTPGAYLPRHDHQKPPTSSQLVNREKQQ
jgi:hypothetical protein